MTRILWAIIIVFVDLITFFVPLTALFAAYIIVVRPPFFREWINKLYA